MRIANFKASSRDTLSLTFQNAHVRVRKYLSIVLVMATSVFFTTGTSIDDASAVDRAGTTGCWVVGATLTKTLGGEANADVPIVHALVTDNSGKYIYAGTFTTGLLISKTGGSTWSRVTEIGAKRVDGVATDSTGKYVYATVQTSDVMYVSSNYGESFSTVDPSLGVANTKLGEGAYASGVATDSTGQYVYVSAGLGAQYFYKSIDWGVSFNKVLTPGHSITALATGGTGLSAGKYLLSGGFDAEVAYSKSNNSGTTFTKTTMASGLWNGVAMSSDGSVQVITNAQTTTGVTSGLRISKDSGVNFAAINNFKTAANNAAAVTNVAMSADGSVILAGSEAPGIGGWISTDTGTSFTPIATLTGSYAGASMRSSALSGDGTKVYSIFENTNKFVTLIKNPDASSITANYSMGLASGSVTSTTNPTGQCGTGLVLAQPSSTSAVIDGFNSTFLGWKDPSGNLWQPGVAYAGALTSHAVALTASWSTPPRTISYNNNGTYNGGTTTGTSPSNQSYTAGESTLTLATKGTLGLGTAVLTGWNSAANGSGTSYSLGQTGVSVETNTTLYAQWAAPITYNSAPNTGSQASETYTVSTGAVTLPVSTTFTKLGHSFGGWSDTTTSTTPITTYSTLSAVNLYAIWTRNEYAATFYKNNESATGTMAVESKTAATALTTNSFLLANKVFNEWNTAADGSGTRYTDRYTYPFLASISLYAQWGNVITYSTLGADSGTPLKPSETWTAGAITNLSSVGTMKKAGYSLGGWSDGTTTYTTTYTPTTGITLNPVWTPNTYTVSFNKNGATSGTLPSDQTWIESTTALTLSGNTGTLVKDGNTWGGWAESASSGQSAITTFSSTSETLTTTLYAIWNKVSYSVTYALNGGTSTLPTEISHTINETFTVAATPIKDTFIFGGWSDGKTTTSAGNSYSVKSSTVTLTAQWIATYEISYLMNGSLTTPVSNTIYTVDSITATASAPTRTGYTFDHWKDSNGDTYTAGSNFKVIRDSALKAQWTAVAYTVTYSLNSGTSSLPTQANVNITNSFTIAATEPTRAGYRFTGWSDGTNTYGEGATYTVGSANITLTAQWTAINYTVTYELGGGTGTRPSHAAVNIGDTFTVSTEVNPTWLAHTFAGWSDGSSDYAKSATYTTSSSNITLTAKWTQNGYTEISYALDGGSGTLPTQPALLEGSTFIVASGAALTKSGKAFIGWNDATKTYQFNESHYVGPDTDSIVLTAQWETGYSVTYSADTATVTGTVPTDAVLRIASATFTLSSGSTLSRSGYTFAGWSDGASTSLGGTSYAVGSANIILAAQWTLIVVVAPPAEAVTSPPAEAVTSPPAEPAPVQKVEIVPVVIVVVKLSPTTDSTSPVVAAQIAVIKDQSEVKALFAAIPKSVGNAASQPNSSPRANQITIVDVLTSINTQSATTNSLETANFSLPATEIVLSDLVVKALELQVKLVATDNGFSVKPVAGFTGVLVIPIVATIDGVQVTVLNRVVVNPVAPVAIGFTPKSVKESAISWTPSASQVVAYVVEVNGKTLCQTTSSSCPVPALIGPNSKVTISAVGNDQTSSAPEVIPYVAKAPIPALSVAFALNSSRLSSAQKSELRRIAKIIDREGFTRLVVSGFTDAQGSVAANKVLSASRAKATAAFLTQLLPDITVKSSAYGAKKPVKTGKSATAFEANRRSEISVW